MSAMGSTNGTNGHTIPSTTAAELNDLVAQYRTALVALVDLVKREGGYRSWQDQELVRHIERLLVRTPLPDPEKK